MSTRTQLRAQALTWWQGLSPRDQHLASLGVTCLGIFLFWLIAIAPALSTLRDSDHQRAHISQQQAQMLALQAQTNALQTRPPLSRDEALRRLQSISPSPQVQLNTQGDRVSVQLKAVSAPSLANWLTQARNQAQALPLEAHLTRSNSTGSNNAANTNSTVVWDGNLVLRLPNRNATTN
jgi:general secretion pathway protein M